MQLFVIWSWQGYFMFYRIDARCLHSVLLRFSKYSIFLKQQHFFVRVTLMFNVASKLVHFYFKSDSLKFLYHFLNYLIHVIFITIWSKENTLLLFKSSKQVMQYSSTKPVGIKSHNFFKVLPNYFLYTKICIEIKLPTVTSFEGPGIFDK